MSMAGWRCFHMCALLIFFLYCEELVLLLFPLCLPCIQAYAAACRGREMNLGTVGPALWATSTYVRWLFPRVVNAEFPITPCRALVGDYRARFPLLVPLLFTAIRHITSEMAWSYGGLTITRPPLRPLDLNLIWFIIAIRDARSHAQWWCYQ